MECKEVRSYIDCYADGELDPVVATHIDEHLKHCVGCQHALEELTSVRTLIQAGAPYYAAPGRLLANIRARVHPKVDTPTVMGDGSWWQWLRPAALVAGTAVVTWIFALHLNSPQGELISEEVIASHARSTLTSRLTDVESSERHTVKPWLSAKLDFSPPVVDLADAGFPLVGARLDYLESRLVSALVYRRRQHVINLFIWPEKSARVVPASQTLSKQGYQVLHWADSGMTFWAISDLNAGELKLFADSFSAQK